MKIVERNTILNVPVLVLIYLLLCVLTILFFRFFFLEMLSTGQLPDMLSLLVFFTIPLVLLFFLVGSMVRLLRDLIDHQAGSTFQSRLLAYFSIIVLFAAAPVTIIADLSINELSRFWGTVQLDTAMNGAQGFALDAYYLHVQQFKRLIGEYRLDVAGEHIILLPKNIEAVQDFTLNENDLWTSSAYTGDTAYSLSMPPVSQQGFISRELPRDTDTIRYVVRFGKTHIRVISYHLDAGFDESLEIIESEKKRFETIAWLLANVQNSLIFYYVIFFFPTVLMTMILAISFTRRVTQPIIELTEATQQIADGDFSIHILSRRGDELGILIRSFNTMVQNLEHSRNALVKAEKISIWQRMAAQLAHEIKNPLTPIRLSAERVLRRFRSDPEHVGEILEKSMLAIIQEVDGLATMLTEFRTLSQPTEPSLTWTKLKELAEELIVPYSSSFPGVCFNTEYLGSLMVKIDRRRLSQILTNIIINAIDAIKGTGLIEIRSDLVTKWDIQFCRLSIHDTGKGIPLEDRLRVFSPYFTTKESGTGLGLPIVERIVHDHGGAIWFDSTENIGTTFFIDLPLATD
jgi:nitrogen fixation/metabolism regulation signal transduction histidine kinase